MRINVKPLAGRAEWCCYFVAIVVVAGLTGRAVATSARISADTRRIAAAEELPIDVSLSSLFTYTSEVGKSRRSQTLADSLEQAVVIIVDDTCQRCAAATPAWVSLVRLASTTRVHVISMQSPLELARALRDVLPSDVTVDAHTVTDKDAFLLSLGLLQLPVALAFDKNSHAVACLTGPVDPTKVTGPLESRRPLIEFENPDSDVAAETPHTQGDDVKHCKTYNPAKLSIDTDTDMTWEVRSGSEVLLRLRSKAEAEQALTLARSYSLKCTIGPEGATDLSGAVGEYWLPESTEKPSPSEDCIKYDAQQLKLVQKGSSVFEIVSDPQLLQTTTDGIQAKAFLDIATNHNYMCFIGRNQGNHGPDRGRFLVQYWRK